MVYEKFAVAMVGFVHKGAGGVALCLSFEPLAFFILGPELCLERADDDCRDLADRKAPLLAGLLSIGLDDLGVRGYQLYPLAIHYE